MRSVSVFYKEYSSIYNMQVLGESFINQMKRDLTPLTFQNSILCKRIGISCDGFYSSMRPKHKYAASDFAYVDSLEYKFDKLQDECRLQGADVDQGNIKIIGSNLKEGVKRMEPRVIIDSRFNGLHLTSIIQ